MLATTTKQQNWLVHSNTMQEAIAFLEEYQMKPDSLSIREDGWIEAKFVFPAGQSSTRPTWVQLDKQRKVDVQKPLRESRNYSKRVLHVTFRVRQRQSTWQRIKSLVN